MQGETTIYLTTDIRTSIATCEGSSIELLIYIKAKATGRQTVTTEHEEKYYHAVSQRHIY